MQAVTVSVKQCPVLSIPQIKKQGCLHLHPVFRPLSATFVPLGALRLSLYPFPSKGSLFEAEEGPAQCRALFKGTLVAQGLARWVLQISKDGGATTAPVHVPGLHHAHRERFFPYI